MALSACEALEEAGISCWIAPRNVTDGEKFGNEIVSAIKESRVVVLLLSKASNTNRHVENELSVAVKSGSAIITFNVEECEVSDGIEFYISASHWIKAQHSPRASYFPRLAEAVRRTILEQPLPSPAAVTSRRGLVTVATAVVVIAAVFALWRPWEGGNPGGKPDVAVGAVDMGSVGDGDPASALPGRQALNKPTGDEGNKQNRESLQQKLPQHEKPVAPRPPAAPTPDVVVDTGAGDPPDTSGTVPVPLRPDVVLPADDAGKITLEPEQPANYFKWTEWYYDGPDDSRSRMAAAEDAKGEVVRKLFSDAGVDFPPRQLFLRAFKKENIVEVWAASGRQGALSHVATYEICSQSGDLGPKRKEGDGQVPEGFYHLDYYNNHSQFYLSMRVNYPNRSDRILGDRDSLGSAIMIHGDCVSIGCLAMSDERIQELWLMTRAMANRGRKVYVHIFPSRDFDALLADIQHTEHHQDFWRNLKEGFDYFESNRTLPTVSVDSYGRYSFR